MKLTRLPVGLLGLIPFTSGEFKASYVTLRPKEPTVLVYERIFTKKKE